MTTRSVQGLDHFRSRQAQDVGNRWQRIRDAHEAAAKRMWLGSMLVEFTEFELGILRDMGFLSPADEALLAKAKD